MLRKREFGYRLEGIMQDRPRSKVGGSADTEWQGRREKARQENAPQLSPISVRPSLNHSHATPSSSVAINLQ
jgi:hypothetical protein